MDKTERNQMLGTAPVGKLIVKMAVPGVVAQLVIMLYNIVDRIYIGHIEGIGAAALTGVGLCTPILILVMAFAQLAASGSAPRAAIAMGQGNKEEADRIMGNCFTMLLVFAAALTVLVLIFAEPLLRLFGASDATMPYALTYMRIYVSGSLFVLITLGLNPFLTTQGFSGFAMGTVVLGAATNIILDPILIFVLDMGVRGAAFATIISQAVSTVFVLWFLTRSRHTVLHLRAKSMKPDRKVYLPALGLGVSGFVMTSTESLLNICFNASLSRFGGDLAVGSMTIIASCAQLITMPMQGFTQGAQPIMSYNFGAGNMDRVRKCFRMQLLACFTATTLYCLATELFPQVFVQIFNNDPALIEHTMWTMRVYMAGMFAFGLQVGCQQTFLALGQAKVSLVLACLRKIILLIPLIFILPIFFENNVFAVFLAEPVSDLLAAAVTTTVFFRRFDKILRNGPARIGA